MLFNVLQCPEQLPTTKGYPAANGNNLLFIFLCHHHHHNVWYLLHPKHFISAPIVNGCKVYLDLINDIGEELFKILCWFLNQLFNIFFSNSIRVFRIFIFIESISKFTAIGFSFLWMFFPMCSRILLSGNREISYLLEDISWVLTIQNTSFWPKLIFTCSFKNL